MAFDEWQHFEDFLYILSKKDGYKPKQGEKPSSKSSPLISPAVFNKGDTRNNENVQGWGAWAAIDVDNYETSFDTALKLFAPCRFVCYSSASSTKQKPKFRVILPLSRYVEQKQIRHLWFSLNTEFNSLGDPQTKDLSRMYYVPAQYPNAFNFIVSNRRSPILDVDKLLDKYDYARESFANTFTSGLSPELQKQIEQYRKDRLTNTSFSWSGLHDCPFVNKRLVLEYRAITETGWYAKMFQLMISIASLAMKNQYPITANQIAALCTELDNETGGWYKNRNMIAEADRAIAFACKAI